MAPKSSRKRQTRLQFNPLPSSSPQRPEAFVRLDNGERPSKRRKHDEGSSARQSMSPNLLRAIKLSEESHGLKDGPDAAKSLRPGGLPTPAPSSQLENAEDSSNEEVSHLSLRQGLKRPILKKHFRNQTTMDTDDDVPVSSGRPHRTPRKKAAVMSDSDTESASDSHNIPSASSSTNQRPTKRPIARSFLSGGSSGNAPISSRSRRSKPTSPRKRRHEQPPSRSSNSDEDSLLEELKGPSPAKKTKLSGKKGRLARRVQDETSGEESEDSEDGQTPKKTGRRLMRKRPSPSKVIKIEGSGQSQESDDEPITPARRRRSAQDDLDELHEDTDDLSGTDLRESRTRGGLKMSKREENRLRLEELKRKRLDRSRGNATTISDEDSQTEGASAAEGPVSISDDDLDDEYAYEHAPKNEDEYESDFVEEDGAVGIDLAKAGISLKLTNRANLKPYDYFKTEVEWMIHNKIDPAFERYDEVYLMAHEKLDDEVMGRAQSTFHSAAWTPEFTKALKSRPEFLTTELGSGAWVTHPKCDACNRSGHPPKFRITFTGNRYDKKTLERVATGKRRSNDDDDDDDEDEDDENDESSSSSEEAEEEDDEDEEFLVGRFCFGNAEIAHALYHWRYQLNGQMIQWLRDNGHLDAEKVVERENWSRKKRQKKANKIVDGMNESGEMQELYRMFKKNLDAARSSKPQKYERRR